jgi:hypothetical protein
MHFVHRAIKFARKTPREQAASLRYRLVDRGWIVPHEGNDRTTYVVGLFGTGRWYVNSLIVQNLLERARNFRDDLRFHSGPTSMIYSGHAAMKYHARGQALPDVTGRILEAVGLRAADLIFVVRHPLDALVTNWVWFRTFDRYRKKIDSVSDVYDSTADLCDDLEKNFPEFQAFAEGERDVYVGLGGPRCLSLHEFVEESELFMRSEALSLRLEDFMADAHKGFSKIIEVMSAKVDSHRLRLDPPRTKPYRYMAVRDKVPLFEKYIERLNGDTKMRIERIGYSL